MGKKEKRLREIMRLSKDLRADEIISAMKDFGYTAEFPSGGSSHCTFRKPGCAPVTIPIHGKIPVEYVKLIKKAIEEELRREE